MSLFTVPVVSPDGVVRQNFSAVEQAINIGRKDLSAQQDTFNDFVDNELPTTYATKAELPDLSSYAQKSDIPTDYVHTSQIDINKVNSLLRTTGCIRINDETGTGAYCEIRYRYNRWKSDGVNYHVHPFFEFKAFDGSGNLISQTFLPLVAPLAWIPFTMQNLGSQLVNPGGGNPVTGQYYPESTLYSQ